MNISYNRLKELIDIDLPAEELARRLTGVGLAVEGIHAHRDDLVFDIDLTSNRPDCLSHLGVARELSAITNYELRITNVKSADLKAEVSSLVVINDPDLCHRFTARIIRNVKIGPSPQWMVDRLEAIGERSINNVADITNYVMHELGQPMHAFDLDKLTENRIVVRRSRPGERLMTLKEVECELDESVLAICDAVKPVAIGGVVGGLDTSITDQTDNVLLEVAYFKRESIRGTARKLGLATEASYRFERGVDIENLISASNRATELICELAGGEAAEFVDLYPTKSEAIEIASEDISASVERLTGLQVDVGGCRNILRSLGIAAKGGSEISNLKSEISDSDRKAGQCFGGSKAVRSEIFIVPSWRHDLAIEEDLVEEIARHIGYDKIDNQLPAAFGAGEYQPTEERERRMRLALADLGFDEALSYSFIDTKFDGVFATAPGVIDENEAGKFVTLRDSVIEGAVRMRPTLIPGLLEALRLNLNHQRRDVKLFEIGKVFAARSGEDGLPNEQDAFAIVVTGGEMLEDRALPGRELDFYDVKGAMEAALGVVDVKGMSFQPAEVRHLRTGQTAEILVDETTVGYVGRLSDEIAATYKFKQPVFVAEINLEVVLQAAVEQVAYHPIPKFPGIARDVSFLAKRSTEFAEIRKAILEQGNELCRNIIFADIYKGKGLAEDERSVTVRIQYRSDERTLLEDEVELVHQQILAGVEERIGIRPRM